MLVSGKKISHASKAKFFPTYYLFPLTDREIIKKDGENVQSPLYNPNSPFLAMIPFTNYIYAPLSLQNIPKF